MNLISLLDPNQVSWLQHEVAEYISAQRVRYAKQCSPLPDTDRHLMANYFSSEDLYRVHVLDISPERVPNPSFYPQLRAIGFTNLPDFTLMAAITFEDVVVSHTPFTPRLLFHELVHVVQYRLLGVEVFAQLYVQGFLTGGSYEAIPLEICAYSLEHQFVAGNRFDVEQEVQKWIAAGRF